MKVSARVFASGDFMPVPDSYAYGVVRAAAWGGGEHLPREATPQTHEWDFRRAHTDYGLVWAVCREHQRSGLFDPLGAKLGPLGPRSVVTWRYALPQKVFELSEHWKRCMKGRFYRHNERTCTSSIMREVEQWNSMRWAWRRRVEDPISALESALELGGLDAYRRIVNAYESEADRPVDNKCNQCDGTGKVRDACRKDKLWTCGECHGTGKHDDHAD